MLSDWISIFSSCHNTTDNGSLQFIAWPDGKSYFEQDNIIYEMFSLIKSSFYEDANRKMKQQLNKKGSRRV